MKTKYAVCWFEWDNAMREYFPACKEFPDETAATEFYKRMGVNDDVPQIELIRKTGDEVERILFKE